MPCPIALDIKISYTLKDPVKHIRAGIPTGWTRTLKQYYHRTQWKWYELKSDTKELKSRIDEPAYQGVAKELRRGLSVW